MLWQAGPYNQKPQWVLFVTRILGFKNIRDGRVLRIKHSFPQVRKVKLERIFSSAKDIPIGSNGENSKPGFLTLSCLLCVVYIHNHCEYFGAFTHAKNSACITSFYPHNNSTKLLLFSSLLSGKIESQKSLVTIQNQVNGREENRAQSLMSKLRCVTTLLCQYTALLPPVLECVRDQLTDFYVLFWSFSPFSVQEHFLNFLICTGDSPGVFQAQ